jgi:hypothetical protein
LTTTRSPTSRVGSIEREGMKNAWIRKPLTSTVNSRAAISRNGSSARKRLRERRARMRLPW